MLPIDNDYKIIQTDISSLWWARVLIQKPNNGSSKEKEQIVV